MNDKTASRLAGLADELDPPPINRWAYRMPAPSWRRTVGGAFILGTAALVLAILVGVAWMVLAALASAHVATDAPGRWGEPSGVANVLTACTDQGIRLYWNTGSDTATGVADPSCRNR